MDLSDQTGDEAGYRHDWNSARNTCRNTIRFPFPAITSAKPARPLCRNLRSLCATAWNTFNTALRRGMDVDEFVPRISFFFNAHNDFFEEIAKYRAARVVWAKTMRDRFGAKNPSTMQMRFHTQTAGVSLTVQQPLNQHRARCDSGTRRSSRRHADLCTPTLTTKHSLCRPTSRSDRASHTANHCRRNRRRQTRLTRSAAVSISNL